MFRARTTVVHPQDASLQAAVYLALAFAALKLLLHITFNLWQAHIGYGYFRDEMYYIECGRHMAWGYVDHGPIVALQSALTLALFGKSLAGIRLLSALAGAAKIFLTGILAWALGGRRSAQSLAMLAVFLAPVYIALDGFLSMNSWEPVFWMSSMLCVVLMARGDTAEGNAHEKLWLLFGLSSGIGLLNKPSMTFFLVALLAGLLLTPQRKLLFNRWALAGVALLLLIVLPYLLWQIRFHWPTLEFLHNDAVESKNVKLPPIPFLGMQIFNLQPVTLFVWGAGLIALLMGSLSRTYRWIGLTYVIFLPTMMAFHAKDYYVVPIYPVLFAAGGIAWERRFAARARVRAGRIFAFPLFQVPLILITAIVLPMAVPIITPLNWVAYTKAIHLYSLGNQAENEPTGILPQFYADRFGWQEEADEVARIYHSLSSEDQKKVGILCSNYGEASAINFLDHGLPFAISGHNNYFLWGPHGASGEIMIVVAGATPAEMHELYGSVEIVGRMNNPLSMPYERRNIYLVRNRKKNLADDWPSLKHYI